MRITCQLSKPQEDFMRRAEDPLVIMQCGVGSGKTVCASIWTITNMLKGRRLVAGALTHSALMKTLFRQIYELAWKWGLKPKMNKQDKTITIGDGIVYGYSNEAPDDVLGLSDIYGMVIDEASRCCQLFYNNLSDRIRGIGIGAPRKRLITSPCNEPNSQWFNDLCDKHPEEMIHASLLTNPFVSDEYIAELTERYGYGSPLYRQQVLGELVSNDFLNAIVRWEDFPSLENSRFSFLTKPTFYGMDLAGSTGRDSTVGTIVNETGLLEQRVVQNADTQGQVSMLKEAYSEGISYGCLDGSGGFGNGVYDTVKHDKFIKIRKMSFSEKPEKEEYLNIRAEMYAELAQAIKSGFYIDTSKYKELVEELRNTLACIDQKGKLRIIPKEDIRRAIGRSPDRADSLALAVYAMNHKMALNVSQIAMNVLNLNHF